MMRDPDENRTPWLGAVRLVAEFELPITEEDDVVDSLQAEEKAAEQLRHALTAAVKCMQLGRFAREVLSTWSEVTIIATDEDPEGWSPPDA